MPDIITAERTTRAGGSGLPFALTTKFVNQPIGLSQTWGAALQQSLRKGEFGHADIAAMFPSASKFIGARDYSNRYRVTDDGIALVPVSGLLVDRGDWLGDLGGWATSYEGLAEQFRRLAKDSVIKSVVLDIDSGGGVVAGLWDLCAEIGKLKKSKKVYAVAANFAASAAYAIGSMAHEFYVSRAGTAGSVGVIVIHQSYARALEGAGIDTTIIAAGEHKADGNPFTPLSHGARAEFAASIDQTNNEFVAHVAKHRGLSEDDVRGMQARVYSGSRAVDAGLADGVKSVEDLLDYLRGDAKSGASRGKASAAAKQGGRAMSEPTPAAEARPDYSHIVAGIIAGMNMAAQMPQQAQKAAAPAAPASPAAPAAAAVTPAAEAKPAEKDRIKAILGCEAAKTRPGLAQHLALETDLDPAMAASILDKAPVEAAAQGAQSAAAGAALAAQMAKPGAAAGVKPEGNAGADARPALKDVVARKFGKKEH